jgi:uncharacterized coiled-coil DUF342 family protein
MRRTEELFSKNIRLKTRDPFSMGLKIRDLVSEFGELIEKKNVYETDGPRKRVELSFELKRAIDKFTTKKLMFDLNGESNSRGFLDIRFMGQLQIKMKRSGPITRTFNDFYISEMLPHLKEESINLKDIGNELEKKIKALAKS